MPALEARTRLLELAGDHERLSADLARERRRVLMVNQNYRWFPAPRLDCICFCW